MTNHPIRSSVRIARIAPFAAAVLLATACGSTTTSPPAAQPAEADALLDITTPTTTPAPTATLNASVPEAAPSTTQRSVDMTLTSSPLPWCGDFGPIPPRPDSMPTLMYDTDGDGNADDEVTAYGGGGGWVVRVVENDVVSEAQTSGVDGWAFISNAYQVDGRDYVEVTDNDVGTIFTLATVDGCVELLDTRSPIADLAAATP